MGELVLRVVLVLATSVWIGGLVTIAVVARVAAATVGPAERVAFFRGLGRAYGVVGSVALLAALATGAVLAAQQGWSSALRAAVVVAVALLAATVVGVRQARRMTRLRQGAVTAPGNPAREEAIARGAEAARILRALIAVLSLALVILGVLVAS